MHNVLFVCTGNTCRSPMAAAIFNKMVKDRGISGVRASSAGTHAERGMGPTPQAIAAARNRGLDIRRHRSRPLTHTLAADADLVLTMTGRHWYDATEFAPRGKVAKLTAVGRDGDEGDDILDPFGGPVALYESVADQLESEIARAMPDILQALSEPSGE